MEEEARAEFAGWHFNRCRSTLFSALQGCVYFTFLMLSNRDNKLLGLSRSDAFGWSFTLHQQSRGEMEVLASGAWPGYEFF
jgi:hypothetical protein